MTKRGRKSEKPGITSHSPPRKSTRYAQVGQKTKVIVKTDKLPLFDSTHCPVCGQEIVDGDLYTHIQDEHKENFVTEAKDLALVKEGEKVAFVVKMQGAKVITYPPIYLSDRVPEEYASEYGESYLTSFHTKLAGLDVTWGEGGFSIEQPPSDRTVIE